MIFMLFTPVDKVVYKLSTASCKIKRVQRQMNYPAASYGVSEVGCFAWLSMTDQCHSEAESRKISLQIHSKLREINL